MLHDSDISLISLDDQYLYFQGPDGAEPVFLFTVTVPELLLMKGKVTYFYTHGDYTVWANVNGSTVYIGEVTGLVYFLWHCEWTQSEEEAYDACQKICDKVIGLLNAVFLT